MHSNSRAVLLSGISNFMELYNYILFAAMIPIISTEFFPSDSEFASLSMTYASFGITFLVSPIGSLYWGKLGDKYGSAFIIQYSTMLMALPSILIALLPNYESIGMLAPISIILLRILQGFSASGEVQGSKILAMNSINIMHWGKTSGFISACGALGVLFAFLFTKYASASGNQDLWRYGFMCGGALVILSRVIKYYFRNRQQPSSTDDKNVSAITILGVNKLKASYVMIISGILGILSYTLHAFLNSYIASISDFTVTDMYSMSLIALSFTAISAVLCGMIIDTLDNKKLLFFFNALIPISCLGLSIIWQMITSNNITNFIISYSLFGIILGFYACTSGTVIFKVFPKSQMCRGLLPSNAFGVAIFGGMTPMVMHYLAHINHYLPVMVFCAFCLVSLILLHRISRTEELKQLFLGQ